MIMSSPTPHASISPVDHDIRPGSERRAARAAVVVGTLAVLLALPLWGASAAPPKPWLPDATLWCGTEYETHIAPGDWVLTPTGGRLWIHTGAHADQYAMVAHEHYWLDGIHHDPLLDLSGAAFLGSHSYGLKTGLQARLECQVVSRWIDLDGTVFVPLTLARLP
jgi:hypothetical protein